MDESEGLAALGVAWLLIMVIVQRFYGTFSGGIRSRGRADYNEELAQKVQMTCRVLHPSHVKNQKTWSSPLHKYPEAPTNRPITIDQRLVNCTREATCIMTCTCQTFSTSRTILTLKGRDGGTEGHRVIGRGRLCNVYSPVFVYDGRGIVF